MARTEERQIPSRACSVSRRHFSVSLAHYLPPAPIPIPVLTLTGHSLLWCQHLLLSGWAALVKATCLGPLTSLRNSCFLPNRIQIPSVTVNTDFGFGTICICTHTYFLPALYYFFIISFFYVSVKPSPKNVCSFFCPLLVMLHPGRKLFPHLNTSKSSQFGLSHTS